MNSTSELSGNVPTLRGAGRHAPAEWSVKGAKGEGKTPTAAGTAEQALGVWRGTQRSTILKGPAPRAMAGLGMSCKSWGWGEGNVCKCIREAAV